MSADGDFLLCRAGPRLGALPLVDVIETMRPLPIETVTGTPTSVMGVSVIRGEAVPVVALTALLGLDGAAPARLVTVRSGARIVALATDEVIGVIHLPGRLSAELPALISPGLAEGVEALGVLDAHLLAVIRGARLVPDAVWSAIARSQSVRSSWIPSASGGER